MSGPTREERHDRYVWLVGNLGRCFLLFVAVAILNVFVRQWYEPGFDPDSYLTQPIFEVIQLSLLLLTPVVPYLLILARLPSTWSLVSTRVAALALSPLIGIILIVSLIQQGLATEPTLVLYEFVYPLLCGAFIRLRPTDDVMQQSNHVVGQSGVSPTQQPHSDEK